MRRNLERLLPRPRISEDYDRGVQKALEKGKRPGEKISIPRSLVIYDRAVLPLPPKKSY